MPKQKDLKRLIRGRMRKTGESYTAARLQILQKTTTPSPLAKRGATVATSRPSTNGAHVAPAGQPAAASTRSRAGSSRKAPPANVDYAKLAGMSDAAIEAKTGCTWEKWVGALDYAGAAGWTHREIAEFVREKFGVPDWWTQAVTVGYERIRGLRAIGQRRDGSYEASKSRTVAAPIDALYRAFTHAPTRRRWLPAAVKIRTAVPDKSVRITWEDGTSVEAYFVAKGAGKAQVAIQHRKLPDQAASARMKAYWTERLAALAELLGAS
jgi:uncharacterized protein YndB with AHSA1/START domain